MFKVKKRMFSKEAVVPKERQLNLKDLKRIFIEALEIIFMYQNQKRENFGAGKLTHFMDQIIPTAYIYNTAYWIFYESSELRPITLCCCSRYGCVCQHKFNEKLGAWLEDCDVEENPTFVPKFEGTVFPKDISFVAAVSQNYIDIFLHFCVSSKNNNSSANYCIVNLISRYNIMREIDKKETETFLIFDPSPILHKFYGTLMKDVLLKMYKYFVKKIVVSMDSSFYTLRRAHSYAYTVPGINYNIDVPSIFSTSYTPLTQIDYDMIVDICSSLLSSSKELHILEVIGNFMHRSIEEFESTKELQVIIDDPCFLNANTNYYTLHW